MVVDHIAAVTVRLAKRQEEGDDDVEHKDGVDDAVEDEVECTRVDQVLEEGHLVGGVGERRSEQTGRPYGELSKLQSGRRSPQRASR